jgi:hypothetical protein
MNDNLKQVAASWVTLNGAIGSLLVAQSDKVTSAAANVSAAQKEHSRLLWEYVVNKLDKDVS